MAKRKPDKELNHDNWDEEDTAEEIGTFQKASDVTLKSRVIKQARRRIINNSMSVSEPKAIFAGFTGFINQSESKKFAFNTTVDASTTASVGSLPESRKFNFNSNATTASIGAQPFKFPSTANASTINSDTKSSDKVAVFAANKNQINSKAPDSPSSSTVSSRSLGRESMKPDTLNDLSAELQKTVIPVKSENTNPTSPDEIFLQKLRSLNLLCAEWIIKHLNENLSYILTPIFADYQKYLNKLKEERQRNNPSKKAKLDSTPLSTTSMKSVEKESKPLTMSTTTPATLFKAPNFKSSLSKFNSFSSLPTEEQTSFIFPAPPSEGDYSVQFPTRNNDVTGTKTASYQGKGDSGFFKFTAPPKTVETKSSEQLPAFSFTAASTVNGNLFSGLSRSALPSGESVTDEQNTKTDQEQDVPPPVVNETITEDGSIYEKKCKVFIKKDGIFVDHGVGFLFLKLIGDEKKCQLIVRANNKLATIILNVLLSANIPVQLMGTNNVMLICCPTPESKPSSVLLRVKTTEDAEELLKTLNDYRK